MNKLLQIGLVLALLLSSFSSCSIFRKGSRKPAVKDTAVAVTPIDTAKPAAPAEPVMSEEKRNLIAALTPLYKRALSFNTFSGKAKMNYEGKGQKHDFTANFRIKKNNIIWVSVTAMGGIVQVARIYVTPDTFKLVNFLEKEVTVMSLVDAGKLLPTPADFSILQNLVLGTILSSRGTPGDATDLGNLLSLYVNDGQILQQIGFSKSDSTVSSIHMRTATSYTGPSGTIQYRDYDLINGRKFPRSRTVDVLSAGDRYHLEMDFNNAAFDNEVDFPFSIPKNYKRK
jgi:hypothetical protein